MTEQPLDPVQALFDQALDLPPEERSAFLDAACADDAALRAEVESLLACDAGPQDDRESRLQCPLLRPWQDWSLLDEPAAGAVLPESVGRYRVLRLLGAGGMGAVYEAEQDNPRRAVALKVIRPGLVASSVVKRFTQEAQILGRLHHPGIAQVYAAGLAAGQPYFAMELIAGRPLDEYARIQRLEPPARLELVAKVCDAVQHAHEKGVIHRDLKPGNILVEASGQPKVLDFGVARATNADVRATTAGTEAGQLVGTLAYMSPEQVAADPAALDGRSDVYALGVILYELLAGRLPYQLENRPLPEAARLIREEEPTRLGAVDTHLRGDVETIVARALEKDRARRYPSAGALADDLRRHLHHEPIRARPTSALYQLRKYARRHPAFVSGLLAFAGALVVGTIFSVYYAVRADRSATEADVQSRAALAQAYRARLAAACAGLQSHDVADAARQLDEAPPELRGWEWHHLHSRLDDSSGRIALEPGEWVSVLPRPEGIQVGRITKTSLRLTDLDGVPSRTILLDLEGVLRPYLGNMCPWLTEWLTDGRLRLWDELGRVPCLSESPAG
jgi:predicted Ser/Thr protein kinase